MHLLQQLVCVVVAMLSHDGLHRLRQHLPIVVQVAGHRSRICLEALKALAGGLVRQHGVGQASACPAKKKPRAKSLQKKNACSASARARTKAAENSRVG